MRIAVHGGTFDPIHYGHLRAAEEVSEGIGLDKVLFMPAFQPPHKPEEKITQAQARLEMIRLAIKDNPRFEASDIEMKRGGRSYTVDTVRELKKEGLSLYLIVGNDSFNEITTWCEYEEIIGLAGLIVVPRPGYPVKKVAEVLPVELARKFWYDSATDSYQNSWGTSVVYFKTTLMDISSSEIREMVRRGLSVRYLMPTSVIDYIAKEGLYRQPS